MQLADPLLPPDDLDIDEDGLAADALAAAVAPQVRGNTRDRSGAEKRRWGQQDHFGSFLLVTEGSPRVVHGKVEITEVNRYQQLPNSSHVLRQAEHFNIIDHRLGWVWTVGSAHALDAPIELPKSASGRWSCITKLRVSAADAAEVVT